MGDERAKHVRSLGLRMVNRLNGLGYYCRTCGRSYLGFKTADGVQGGMTRHIEAHRSLSSK